MIVIGTEEENEIITGMSIRIDLMGCKLFY